MDVIKVITGHLEGDMNVGTKFHCNLSNSYQDISLKLTNVKVVQVKALPKSVGLILWTPIMSVPSVIANYPIIVKTSQFWPKCNQHGSDVCVCVCVSTPLFPSFIETP